MITLMWPLVLVITVGLYVLILITLPFNAIYATLFLYTLIAYWSRLPGVGIVNPFFFLYNADFVDIFTLLIAINLGPIPAIIFTWFTNISSRMCGVFPDWPGVIQDAAIQSFIALIAPILSILVGGNLITVILIYTIMRVLGFFAFWFIWPRRSFAQQIITTLTAGSIVFVINSFYAKLFGSFFDNLLEGGVAFNWLLFFIATIIIVVAYVVMYGLKTPKKKSKKNKIIRNVIRIVQPNIRGNGAADLAEREMLKKINFGNNFDKE